VLIFRTTELSEYKTHPIYFSHGLTPVRLNLKLWTEHPLWKPLETLIFGYRKRKEKINKLEYVRFEVLAAVLLKS